MKVEANFLSMLKEGLLYVCLFICGFNVIIERGINKEYLLDDGLSDLRFYALKNEELSCPCVHL